MFTCPHCGIDILESGVTAVSSAYQYLDIATGDYNKPDYIDNPDRYLCRECCDEIPESVINEARACARGEISR